SAGSARRPHFGQIVFAAISMEHQEGLLADLAVLREQQLDEHPAIAILTAEAKQRSGIRTYLYYCILARRQDLALDYEGERNPGGYARSGGGPRGRQPGCHKKGTLPSACLLTVAFS